MIFPLPLWEGAIGLSGAKDDWGRGCRRITPPPSHSRFARITCPLPQGEGEIPALGSKLPRPAVGLISRNWAICPDGLSGFIQHPVLRRLCLRHGDFHRVRIFPDEMVAHSAN